MSEKRFTCKVKKQGDIEYVLFIDTSEEVEYMSFFEIIDLVNKLNDDNEKLRKKINTYESEPFEDGLDDETKISIFNKDKGDWKWNDNNDTIINIRTGEKFYLRNSGAVENLVDLLNEQQATLNKQKEEIINSHIAYVESLNEIKDLKEENEQLRQSRDYWCKSAKLHSKYFNCLEKAIERAYEEKPYPTEEDINRIYAELEKEIDV